MVLTHKQRSDLEFAILEYLNSRGNDFAATIVAFKQESGLELPAKNDDASPSIESTPSVLEKKWSSIVRLQKKILDLEDKLSLQEELRSKEGQPGRAKTSASKYLPRPPAKADLVGHRSPVTAVAMHPVYSTLASGSEDASIKIWDIELGQREHTLKGHTNYVVDLNYSPDGSLLASCSVDLSVKIWNTETYECVHTLRGHDHTVSSVAWLRSPKGSAGESAHLASCGRDQTIRLWDVTTGYSVGILTGHDGWIRSLAARPESANQGPVLGTNEALIVSGGNDTTVRVWAVGRNGKVLASRCDYVLRGHSHVVECVAFSNSSADRAIQSNKVSNAKPEGTPDVVGSNPGGEYVVSGSRDKTIRIWSLLNGGNCVATFSDHGNWVRKVIFHPQGGYILSCSDDRTIRVYDLKAMRCTRTLEDAHAHFISSISMHSSAVYLASGSVDKTIRLWECY